MHGFTAIHPSYTSHKLYARGADREKEGSKKAREFKYCADCICLCVSWEGVRANQLHVYMNVCMYVSVKVSGPTGYIDISMRLPIIIIASVLQYSGSDCLWNTKTKP